MASATLGAVSTVRADPTICDGDQGRRDVISVARPNAMVTPGPKAVDGPPTCHQGARRSNATTRASTSPTATLSRPMIAQEADR
jgi:hypothetical protein